MVQNILTIAVVAAAVSYSLIRVYTLFHKKRKGNRKITCSAGCASCKIYGQ